MEATTIAWGSGHEVMGGDCLTLVNTIHIMFLLTPGLQHPAQTLRRKNTYEDHVCTLGLVWSWRLHFAGAA